MCSGNRKMTVASFVKRLHAAEERLASLIMMAIVVLVFVAASSRYLGSPINWSVDLAQGLFVWAVYLGASLAAREDRHIGVSYFIDLLPPAGKRLVTAAGNLLVIAFLGCVVWYGIQISIINVNRQLTSIPISYSFVTIAASAGCLLMMMTIAGKTVTLFRSAQPGETER